MKSLVTVIEISVFRVTNHSQQRHKMDSESNEKLEGEKQARIAIPGPVHERVLKHQAKLIGRKGRKVTFADACVDLLDVSTKKYADNETTDRA